MSQIIKSFLGIFLIMFITATVIGLLGAFLQVMDAQNLHAQIINEMENSDFSPTVMEKQMQDAQQKNCKLKLTLYGENEVVYECESPEQIPQQPGNIESAEVALSFLFQVGFFETAQSHTLIGYAR